MTLKSSLYKGLRVVVELSVHAVVTIVMLYAISQVDQTKFELFVSGLADPFDNPAVSEGLLNSGTGFVGVRRGTGALHRDRSGRASRGIGLGRARTAAGFGAPFRQIRSP